ncbi:MAG TPA: beta-ketoacyl-ACP synthase II [Acidimicrobiales bacterium]|nr:beta-ketoacyl-ACP synthase II [Acidimicrobiales bacterium]
MTAVAITGMGVKTPIGLDLDTYWEGLCSGRSAGGPITSFDTSEHPVTFACEIGEEFEVGAYVSAKEAAHLDRVTHLGFAAATDAIADAGDLGADPARIAVVAGTGVGGLLTLEAQIATFVNKGAMRVSPFLVPMMMSNATAAFIAIQHGFTGPNFSVVTACAAGANAIGEAARLIRAGDADVVIAGGSEASITPVGLAAFHRMGALSRRKDDPAHASRPFDADRDGFVMGEGAGFLVLESLDRARARGARVRALIAGYGRNTDAHHITAPSPGGDGAVRCMQLALEDAGLPTSAIGHINAHGTSTPLNDASEAEAVLKVFGGQAPPVTSVKGATGHLIGAAGAVEAIASVLAMEHAVVFPTANHEHLDPALGPIDVVHGAVRPLAAAPALSNSFGFGGHNASLVVVPAP